MFTRRMIIVVALWLVPHAFAQTDPFADVAPAVATASDDTRSSWFRSFLHDNLGFRTEIMSEFDTNAGGSNASRQSLGFDVLKKFSSQTATVASVDFQGRVVRRDGYNAVPNDMEGAGHQGWLFEYHNLYLDLYNVGGSGGRFNLRIGHTYVPFGLNLQTDTHGTLLQLSNGNNFGSDQDWAAGFWGAINKDLNYEAYYLLGSGDSFRLKGQGGLGAVRVALANKFSSAYGIEGGVSVIGGGRLGAPLVESDGMSPEPLNRISTERIGVDGRYRHTAPRGLVTVTAELSGGRDARLPVLTQLYETEYLHGSRRWGIGTQFRRFSEDGHGVNWSAIGELSWYLRNDVANSNSHWIKFNVERQLHNSMTPPHTIVTLQYYFYL